MGNWEKKGRKLTPRIYYWAIVFLQLSSWDPIPPRSHTDLTSELSTWERIRSMYHQSPPAHWARLAAVNVSSSCFQVWSQQAFFHNCTREAWDWRGKGRWCRWNEMFSGSSAMMEYNGEPRECEVGDKMCMILTSLAVML